MGWKPGKYLGKAIKSIGRGIKKIGKGIGKAFKKVFKGIGNFVGKLGPIGMLGMMLIMPQLGAWWGQFGAWADTLVSSGKFFGNVMKGIHTAGAAVGNAYSTVTEGIQKTLNVVTGGTFSTAGAAGYEAGFSDKFTNWMSGQLDKGREFLGLETATPIGTPDVTTDVVPETTTTVPDTKTVTSAYSASDQQVIDQMEAFSDYPNLQESLTSKLSPEGLEMYKGTTVSRYDKRGFLKDPDSYKSPYDFAAEDQVLSDLGIDPTSDPSTWVDQSTTTIKPKPDISTWDKFVDRGKQGYTVFKTGQDVMKTFGLGEEEYESAYSSFVADNYVPIYETSQVDWTNQGYAGQPQYGIGSANYLASINNAFMNDPWYLWSQQQGKE